jgi:hypothetical protein
MTILLAIYRSTADDDLKPIAAAYEHCKFVRLAQERRIACRQILSPPRYSPELPRKHLLHRLSCIGIIEVTNKIAALISFHAALGILVCATALLQTRSFETFLYYTSPEQLLWKSVLGSNGMLFRYVHPADPILLCKRAYSACPPLKVFTKLNPSSRTKAAK